MANLSFENKWVLVTGASSGLGAAIARRLAEKEMANLVITARRKERLEVLKKEIESNTQSQVKIITADLAQAQGVQREFSEAVRMAEISAVINNAGVTYYNKTNPDDIAAYEKITAVNFTALMTLTLKFFSYFRERGSGAILNITSMGAFFPLPYQNVYAAAKHAAQAFTEGLYSEYRKSGIVISSYAPGGIATEMLAKAGLDKKRDMDNPFNMDVNFVARNAIETLKRKKYLGVPGLVNKFNLLVARILPRKLQCILSEKIFRPPWQKN